jgi:tetratricopeptide (TPR) repeat protein
MHSLTAFLIFTLIILTPGLLPAGSADEGLGDPALNRARVMIKDGRPAEALKILSAFQPAAESRPVFHFLSAQALEGMKRNLEAMEQYRSAYLQARSGEFKEQAFLERAEFLLRLKNFDEARIIYKLFLDQFKKSRYREKAFLGIAQSLAGSGLFSEALKYYEKAGDRPEAVFGQAAMLHRLGRLKEADDRFAKGISRDKVYFLSSEALLFYYGENLRQMGKDDQARQYLTSKKEDPVLRKKADIALGLISLKSGKYEEAQKYFSTALSCPDRLVRQEALFYSAESQLGLGRKKEAEQLLQKFRLSYPSGQAYDQALLKLVRLGLEEGRIEQAGAWIREWVFRSSLKKETFGELESILSSLREKDPPRLVSLWKSLGPKIFGLASESFLINMAETLKGSGRPYLELQQWLADHGSEKAKVSALAALAGYQADSGLFDQAQGNIRLLKNLKNSGDETLRLEARIRKAQGDFGAAAERLAALKKVEARDLPLLADSLDYARDVNRAAAFFEKNLRRLEGNSASYIKLADILYDKGKKKEALGYYQKALEKDPLNDWALFRSGSLLAGEEGRKMLSRVKAENPLLGKLIKAGLREKEIEQRAGGTF